jgi:glycosyltransferase involved in cell wall biosynthesis
MRRDDRAGDTPSPGTERQLTVLLTNTALHTRGGSETYLRDVALALLRRGHRPIAFSLMLGPIAEELRRATVPVIDDLDQLGEPPDIIHGQHHLETLMAALTFPGVPIVHFCHGWIPWEEKPLRHPAIRRYVAVDEVCADRLIREEGIRSEDVEVLLNFVDLTRFAERASLPERPGRALVFSNAATSDGYCRSIQTACDAAGIAVAVVGEGAGNSTTEPERLLPMFDLVFAKGRSALEAMAVGCAVVLSDRVGCGPLVTPDNFGRLRPRNFGVRELQHAHDPAWYAEQIARYEPLAAGDVSARVRSDAGLEPAIDRLLGIYRAALATPPPDDQSGTRAAARHLGKVAFKFKMAWEADVQKRRLEHDLAQARLERDAVDGERAALQAEVARLEEALTGQRAQLAESVHEAAERADALGALRAAGRVESGRLLTELTVARRRADSLELVIDAYRALPTLRLRDMLLSVPIVGPAARSVARLAAQSPVTRLAGRNRQRECAKLQEQFETVARDAFMGVPIEGFAESGRMQLDALVRLGLEPGSRLLDVGCGVLRGGYWLVQFLNADRYFGIEPHAGRLAVGKSLLPPGLLAAKRPRFDGNPDFELTVFGETFDFVMADSIWSHAAKSQIETMLDSLLRVSHEKTVLLASYLPAGSGLGSDYLGSTWVGTSHESNIVGVIRHDRDWILDRCHRRGLGVHELPDLTLDHQSWLKITRGLRGPQGPGGPGEHC